MFGYDHVRVGSHVERRINAREAAVIVRIFELSAAGSGLTRIAKALNGTRAPCPRPQQGRPAGWAPASVREILHRETYRGALIYGRTKKRDRSGDIAPTDRPPQEWTRVDAPHLRIVSEALWDAAHARQVKVRQWMATAIRQRGVGLRDCAPKPVADWRAVGCATGR